MGYAFGALGIDNSYQIDQSKIHIEVCMYYTKGIELAEFALLVLESPWWTPRDNPLRASCLPFFQGLERVCNGFNIYYATFYDTAGFEAALASDLTYTSEKRQILYIGAHGDRGAIANSRASSLLRRVSDYGGKIEGVILSSCLVADRLENLAEVFSARSVRWIFGYTCEVDWIGSQLIELALLEALATSPEDIALSTDSIITTLGSALSRFNPHRALGGKDESLWQHIRLIHRAKHKQLPVDITEELIQYAWPSIET